MPMPDGERIASLEARVQNIENVLSRMDVSLDSLTRIAATGNGALRSALIIGGAIGWVVGVVISVAHFLRH